MVGYDTHRHVLILVATIFRVGHRGNRTDDRLEDIGIVVGCLTLQRHTETFETHTGIDHFSRQRLQGTVRLAIELHEHQVPDLDHLRMIVVDHLGTRDGSTLLFRTQVDVDFRTGTTRTCITHLPEVIMFVTIDDVICRQVLFPISGSFVVTIQTFGRTTLEHGRIETCRIQLQHIHQILPSPADRLFLEVIAKRPVTQHLKHRMVISVMTDLFQVVMLTTYAETFL